MLFDTSHILYIIISFVLIFGSIIGCYFIKKEKIKNIIFKISVLLIVAIHYSPLYVDYFSTGTATVEPQMLLPIYPCNIAMWLLIIVAFYKNKSSKLFTYIADFTFYLSFFGGIIGVLFNEIYSGNPNLADWDVLNGLLGHSIMVFSSLMLLLTYVKIRVKNIIGVLIGLVFMYLEGWLIIGIYELCNLEPLNCMYLLHPPFQQYPWINTYLIGLTGISFVFLITTIYEQIFIKKEERWYNQIKKQRRIKDE